MAAALLALLFSCVVVSVAISQPAAANREPESGRHIGLRLLVQPRAGVPLEALDEILRRYGAHRVGAVPQINVHIVELPPQASARAVALMLKDHPEIEFAEVDERVPPSMPSSISQPQ